MAQQHSTGILEAQFVAYKELEVDYSPEVAQTLTARNLQRNGARVTGQQVAGWAVVTEAVLEGRLDLPAEVGLAEQRAAIAAGNISPCSVSHASYSVAEQDESDDDYTDNNDQDDEASDEELLSLEEMYQLGPEDAAEAALDDVLKAQERE